MRELNFDTGLVRYTVNGIEGAVCFNPTDSAFFKKVYELFSELSEKCDQYEKKMKELDDGIDRYLLVSDLDAEIKEAIDALFEKPGLSDLLFTIDGQKVSPNALAGGFPLWANFILAIADEADASIKDQLAKSKSRMEKYTKKYHR